MVADQSTCRQGQLKSAFKLHHITHCMEKLVEHKSPQKPETGDYPFHRSRPLCC